MARRSITSKPMSSSSFGLGLFALLGGGVGGATMGPSLAITASRRQLDSVFSTFSILAVLGMGTLNSSPPSTAKKSVAKPVANTVIDTCKVTIMIMKAEMNGLSDNIIIGYHLSVGYSVIH